MQAIASCCESRDNDALSVDQNLAMERKDFPNTHVSDCWFLLCFLCCNGIFMSAVTGESALMHSAAQHRLFACLSVTPLLICGVERLQTSPIYQNHPSILLIQTHTVHYSGNRNSCLCVWANMRVFTAPFLLSQSSRTLQMSFKTVLHVPGSKAWSAIGPVSL